jgi:serine phosphatase RsbU (regulator of sigma subunit)
VVPGQTYEASAIPLPGHGTIVAFTDGLVERRGESLDLGLERAREAVTGPERPLQDLLGEMAESLGADTADDDTAMLALRWTVKELAWRS